MPYSSVPVTTYPVNQFGTYYTDRPVQKKQPDSPDSSTPQTPPTQSASYASLVSQPTAIAPLVPSSSFSNATAERVKETIARANSVPMEFYHTEFLEYSKETYEKKMNAKRQKRKRTTVDTPGAGGSSSEDETSNKRKKTSIEKSQQLSDDEEDEDSDREEQVNGGVSSTELRRQIHIQSEQKRRAQIKDGFEELRNHLPGCNSKKMSKAALLTRTVQQIDHLKKVQNDLLSEVERLALENESLKKQSVLQRQAMEKIYTFQV
ncbi:hypothetical protein J3Q64DRAFT_1630444 [Phycomyces blakesleeanus]|uniref:BHLH domain-containing protein n=1 Tax=Phycomyces blakesleeanus TaxID=4837 RepID=A0ABR3BDH1_PHYBL